MALVEEKKEFIFELRTKQPVMQLVDSDH